MMKSVSLLLMLCSTMLCHAVDFPDEVRELKELESSRKEAVKNTEALIFLKVNPGNSQEFVEEAVEDYVKRFKRFGPVFLVPLGVSTPNLPETADNAFEALSGSYPRLVVLDPDDDSVITSVPYLPQEDRRSEIKEHWQKVFSYLKDKESRASQAPRPGW